MRAIYLDSLKIHDNADPSAKFVVSVPLQGLEFPAARVSSFDRSGEDGIYITNVLMGERRVSLTGQIINAASDADLIAQRQALMAACAPVRDSGGTLQRRTLRLTAMDGTDYRLTGQVVKASMPMENLRSADWMVDFLSDSPYVELLNPSAATVVPYSGGGAAVPFTLPVTLSAGTGGQASVASSGSAPALPVITLSGPLTNPRIASLTLGRWVQLNLSLGTGDSVVIDMAARTVVQGGTTNRYGAKTADSQFWWLQPGANTLSLTTGSSGDAGSASVSWREAYYGI